MERSRLRGQSTFLLLKCHPWHHRGVYLGMPQGRDEPARQKTAPKILNLPPGGRALNSSSNYWPRETDRQTGLERSNSASSQKNKHKKSSEPQGWYGSVSGRPNRALLQVCVRHKLRDDAPGHHAALIFIRDSSADDFNGLIHSVLKTAENIQRGIFKRCSF